MLDDEPLRRADSFLLEVLGALFVHIGPVAEHLADVLVESFPVELLALVAAVVDSVAATADECPLGCSVFAAGVAGAVMMLDVLLSFLNHCVAPDWDVAAGEFVPGLLVKLRHRRVGYLHELLPTLFASIDKKLPLVL